MGTGSLNSGFTVTGGQMWSLVTEVKHGIDNRTEKLPNSIDAQYTSGFSWARQPALRFQQKRGLVSNVAAVAGTGADTNYSATNAPTNFFFGAGQNGGLYNAFNGTPPTTLLRTSL